MAGYWPSSFFACLRTETKSRSNNSQKRTRPISSHLDRTNLVNKGFIIWLLVKFCLRDKAGRPERARWLHLARSGSQSQRAIWFILPARGASHIIKIIIDYFQLHYLISPLIYDWHVDIINKHSHLLARWWTVCCAHSFVNITLDGTLFQTRKRKIKKSHENCMRWNCLLCCRGVQLPPGGNFTD